MKLYSFTRLLHHTIFFPLSLLHISYTETHTFVFSSFSIYFYYSEVMPLKRNKFRTYYHFLNVFPSFFSIRKEQLKVDLAKYENEKKLIDLDIVRALRLITVFLKIYDKIKQFKIQWHQLALMMKF